MDIARIIAESLKNIPPELATVIMAALPIIELRGALPIALVVFKLPIPLAFFWSIVGNMLPVYFIFLFLEHGAKWLRARSDIIDRWLDWLFERTRIKLAHKVEKHGAWALALFVAVPLPVTGAWSGALAAFVFGLPKKKAFLALLVGTSIAAIIVAFLTLGAAATIKALR